MDLKRKVVAAIRNKLVTRRAPGHDFFASSVWGGIRHAGRPFLDANISHNQSTSIPYHSFLNLPTGEGNQFGLISLLGFLVAGCRALLREPVRLDLFYRFPLANSAPGNLVDTTKTGLCGIQPPHRWLQRDLTEAIALYDTSREARTPAANRWTGETRSRFTLKRASPTNLLCSYQKAIATPKTRN